MNTLYDAEARINELMRSANQARLARVAQAERPNRPIQIYKQGWQYVGQGLIWLGSQLQKPVIQPTATCTTGDSPLALCESC